MEVLKPFRLPIIRDILNNYKFDQPFHLYFSALCKAHKQWGSKDRRIYKSACYAYFRLGYASGRVVDDETIRAAMLAVSDESAAPAPEAIFPHPEHVSERIDFDAWARGLLRQRPLYLVMVKGKEAATIQYLEDNNIAFDRITTSGLRLPADSKCDELSERGWVWVMDLASQEAADLVQIGQGDSVWDACSGAGGKSLYLCNKNNIAFSLLCSDKRFGILENLKTRFRTSGLKQPRVELTDLTSGFQLAEKFDKIVLDVPCSGSGTWGRTPENISGFDLQKIDMYADLQRQIFANVLPHLKPEGLLYYMTCSVFKEENEGNIAFFIKRYGLKCQSEHYLPADAQNSDYLYCAVLKY